MIIKTKEQSDNMTSSKELHEMTINELGQLFPITIQNYTDKWIELYEAEKQLITDNFAKSEIISIDHIGSTAIPGLKTKPIIDILFQVSEQIGIPKMKTIFKSLNYHINEPTNNPPPHLTFVKGYKCGQLLLMLRPENLQLSYGKRRLGLVNRIQKQITKFEIKPEQPGFTIH